MREKNILRNGETPHDYRIRIEKKESELMKKFDIKKVLEVFSGDGRNVVHFAKLGYSVIGIENSTKLSKDSLNLIRKESVNARILRHPIFNKKFPFDDEEFDFVYSYQYLNHNFKDRIEGVFNEIFRVLKGGGLFTIKITDIEQFNLKPLGKRIYEEHDPQFPRIRYEKVANQTFVKLEGEEEGIPHYGFYKAELADSLRKAGFKPVNIRKVRWNIVGNFTK